MDRNYNPNLKFSEFEEDNKTSNFKAHDEFFIFQNNYNSHGTSNKKYINKRHHSEYEEIIPQDCFDNDNNTIFSSNNFYENRGLSSYKKNFIYNLNNLHFNDINYRKYLSNLKNESSSSKSKRIHKKNNSVNKYNLNIDTYNIIQIYEAPPLELTPILEIEKVVGKRRPPKYYRKKTIYTLEDENEKNSDNISNNNININHSKYNNNTTFLRRSKLSNYKVDKKISNDNIKKEKKEEDNQNNLKNDDEKCENKKDEDISCHNKINYYKKYIKYTKSKDKDNIHKNKDSLNHNNMYNEKEENLSNIKKENNMETKNN